MSGRRSLRGRLALLLVLAPASALAERPAGVCVDVGVDFTPTDNMQIVAWIEKPDGTFVDTIYVTNKVGRFGLGNRPGRYDFKTGSPTADTFPYGRRITTFPVWAHRHGQQFPLVVFQNGDENNLSHPFMDSSPESPPPYCRPMQPAEAGFDTGTCASQAFTDKGVFAEGQTSLYPPRADLTRKPGTDSPSVEMFREMNTFDAVSQATPPGGVPATASWAAPQSLEYGNYVLFVEAAKTYDFNSTYTETTFPPPTAIPWAEYGKAWRGQPSIVYSVPFTIGETPQRATVQDYAGYGDPTGQSGAVNPPDATITTDTPGSGASRMQLVSDGSEMYRVRVRATPELDAVAPAAATDVKVMAAKSTTADLAFVAPGDDDMTGKVTGYDIRVRVGSPITAENFDESMPVNMAVTPDAAGSVQSVQLMGLLPETDYYVGIRAFDNCFNQGELVTTKLTTAARDIAEVDWCFVATAAYGSILANDVEMLRHFRDSMLKNTVMGELFVETYYTFGPAVAGVVGESDLLRSTARSVLAPIVAAVRRFAL
ncbi:MAG: fibronectin type III domain-containing protein [Kofleriaceae bacterium]|nr:fibronectin type III domain-containing protein [Kofleriaceae bacterium]